MRWLLPWFRPHVGRLVLYEALLLGATVLSLSSSWLVGRALDVDVAGNDRDGLLRTAVLYAGAVLGAGGLTWAARVGIERIAQDVMRGVKERLFAHLLDHDLAFHDQHPPGRLMARVQGDTEALRTLLSEVVLQAGPDLLLFVGLLGVLTIKAPLMAALVAATLPIYAVLLYGFRRVSPQRFLHAREVAARLTGFVAEHLRALPLLRAYGRVDWMLARAERLSEEKFEADYRAGLAMVWFFNSLFAVRTVAYAAILWVGAVAVSRGALTLGVLLMTLDYLRKMFEPFIRLQFHLVTLEKARAGERRIRELLAQEPTIRAPAAPAPWPGLVDALRLEDVHLAYIPGVPVLRGLSLAVPAGRHVALVGATGSGKSTLVQLFFRFRDADAGRVTVDGVDVRTLDPAVLRAHIGLVLQAVHVLPGTVAENLGVDAPTAARLLAEVGLDGRLAPDSLVGEGGTALSRGEAQLLCFARAIATDPSVLVLDEATAAMDPATEARIQALLAARPGRTRVTVAHRLRTVADADHIYVVDKGTVAESGTHAALLALGGRYAQLWRAQLAAEGAAA
ncbi:MAG: ABC transporter ATP-binding protein [Myxococcota bacterium]